MAQEQSGYWFPRRRFGWGWGPPITWQGRVVVAGYGLCVAGPLMLTSTFGLVMVPIWLGVLALTTPALLWVCFRKGEPPGPFRH